MNHPLKFVATTGIVLFFLMLKTGSLAAAREEQPRQPDAQQQEEEKDIPVITNPAVFNEKDLDKLLEKQREYIKKHYPQEQDYFDSRHYSEFDLQNEDEEWGLTIRFDIEEAYQAYMKQHQKEIEREAERLIREGVIQIE
ncbi:hypothetical protein [Akkermansia sp. 54_46]|uniref:hypothetical protein n=1 Tax=Akkermansia sp. 54_46 TaxID=1896967 RepID=UPI0009688A96|nr:hypothetical protein [Akkermansia sp. 54_46]OLA89147.1 MAG: hypothetical protein BHW66_07240 [Akkermansia sp. 54_46]